MTKLTTGVLFVCSHNSARSQMAEGWMRHLAGNRFNIASAGVEPGALNPLAVQAMAEVGIDIAHHTAESITQYLGTWNVHYLIIVCDKAANSCPSDWPGAHQRIHWFFNDPSAATGTHDEKLAVFRCVRDEIRAKIEDWLSELPQHTSAAPAS